MSALRIPLSPWTRLFSGRSMHVHRIAHNMCKCMPANTYFRIILPVLVLRFARIQFPPCIIAHFIFLYAERVCRPIRPYENDPLSNAHDLQTIICTAGAYAHTCTCSCMGHAEYDVDDGESPITSFSNTSFSSSSSMSSCDRGRARSLRHRTSRSYVPFFFFFFHDLVLCIFMLGARCNNKYSEFGFEFSEMLVHFSELIWVECCYLFSFSFLLILLCAVFCKHIYLFFFSSFIILLSSFLLLSAHFIFTLVFFFRRSFVLFHILIEFSECDCGIHTQSDGWRVHRNSNTLTQTRVRRRMRTLNTVPYACIGFIGLCAGRIVSKSLDLSDAGSCALVAFPHTVCWRRERQKKLLMTNRAIISV